MPATVRTLPIDQDASSEMKVERDFGIRLVSPI